MVRRVLILLLLALLVGAAAGESDDDVTYLRGALAGYRRTVGDAHPDTIRTCARLVSLLVDSNRRGEALALYPPLLATLDRVPADPSLRLPLRDLGLDSVKIGRIETAVVLLRRARSMPPVQGEDPVVGPGIMAHQALCHARLGQWSEAADLYRQLLPIWEKMGEREQALLTRITLGNSLVRSGRHREGLEYLEAAEELDPSGQANLLALALEARGTAQRYLGDDGAALESYERALKLAPPPGLQASIFEGQSVAYQSLGQLEAALGAADRCLAVREKLGTEAGLAHQRRANILTELERFDEASAELSRAIELLRERGGIRLGLAIASLANLLFAQGDYQMALDAGEKALEILKTDEAGRPLAQTFKYQAVRYSLLGFDEQALDCIQAAIQGYRETLGDEHPESLECFLIAADLLLARGETEAAREIYERSLTRLGSNPRQVAELYLRLGWLFRQEGEYQRAREQLARAVKILEQATGANSQDLAVALSELAGLEQDAGRPEVAFELGKRAVSIVKAGRVPPRSRAALDILRFHGAIALKRYRATGGNTYLEAADDALQLGLQRAQRVRNSVDDRTRRALSGELLELFPLAIEAAAARGDLERALETADRGTSLALLELLAGVSRPTPTRRDLRLGADASEEAFRRLPVEDYRFIHFACHGILGRNLGLSPALVLSRSDGTDGFLTMEEIASRETPLTAELVVLSACQTGRGRFQPGEGVEGLARAFLRSGAQSVVVSLWTVDDRSTARLMSRFYHHLVKGGQPPAQAMQSARLELIADGEPVSHWAPFILMGSGCQASSKR